MPLKMGSSKEIVSQNIKEMVKAGHKPKQAIAAALAHARKSKKMSDGGEVKTKNQDAGQNNSATNEYGVASLSDMAHNLGFADGGLVGDEPKHYRGLFDLMAQGDQGQIANPGQQDIEKHLASKIQEDDDDMYYSMGGLVEGAADGDLGNKPDMSMSDGTEESMEDEPSKAADEDHAAVDGIPHNQGLSQETMDVIMDRKKRRRFKV